MKIVLKLIIIFLVIYGAEANAQTANEWLRKGQAAADPRVKILYFTKALELGCSLRQVAYNDRGAAKNELGKYKEAIEDFEQSIILKKDNPRAFTNRGVSKIQLGLYGEAAHDFNLALEIEPNNILVWVNLGYAEMGQRNFPKAISDFDKAIELSPQFAPAYNGRGECKEKIGQMQEALTDYIMATKYDPNFAEAYNNKGYMYFQLNNMAQAIRDYDKSIELGGPGFEPARKYREEAQTFLLAQKDQSLPIVKWETVPQRVEYKIFTVQACLESASSLKDVSLYVNGTRQKGILISGASSCPNRVNQQITLKEGENRIFIWAENDRGGGPSEEIVVHYMAPSTNGFSVGIVKGEGERRVAMIVGNAAYTKGNSLLNPGNDARDMQKALSELGFKVLKYDNLSKQDMDKHIIEFTDTLKNYDVGLFYYSGHGLEVNGSNYMLPVNIPAKMDKVDIEYNCVPADWLEEKMGASGADNKTFIVILDACRNNPFRSWRGTTNEAWAAPKNIPSGLITAFATSVGQTASDGKDQNGSYTSILLKYIRTPNMAIDELFRKVRVELKQTGQESVEMSKLTKGFYFNPQ